MLSFGAEIPYFRFLTEPQFLDYHRRQFVFGNIRLTRYICRHAILRNRRNAHEEYGYGKSVQHKSADMMVSFNP